MDPRRIQSTSRPAVKVGPGIKFARALSYAANPLWVPFATITGIALLLPVPFPILGWIGGLSFLFYSLIPCTAALMLLKSNQILTFDIPIRKNRHKLYLSSILSSSIGSLLLVAICYNSYDLISQMAIVFMVNPVLGYMINLRFKISIHAAALSTAGSLFLSATFILPAAASYWFDIWSIGIFTLLLPMMIWARYRLGIHTITELSGGVLAGMGFTLLQISLMQMIW